MGCRFAGMKLAATAFSLVMASACQSPVASSSPAQVAEEPVAAADPTVTRPTIRQPFPVGALQTDCGLGGQEDGFYQFVPTCAGRAPSPDSRLAIIQHAYDDEQPAIELQDAAGKVLGRLPSLSDDMPFAVSWSPDSRRFMVNHHVGSFMDVLQVFQIVDDVAVERPAVVRAAVQTAKARYPCLRPGMILPNGARWTRDGRRVVMVTISRPNACGGDYGPVGDWRPLWMIGDVASGAIDPASIRVATTEGPMKTPDDGPYRDR